MRFNGLTGPASAAHIHTGRSGQPGDVAIPLCGPCSSPGSGTANATASTLAAIQSGGTYVNVHTGMNAAGEIRGQIGATAAIRTTLNARQEYLEGGFAELSCARCDALVRVRKSSAQQTSVQWTRRATQACDVLASHAADGQPTALIPACPSLRESIEQAVRDGHLGVP